MSAEIIDIHEVQQQRESIPMTLKRLYRLIDNNVEEINRQAQHQAETIRDITKAISKTHDTYLLAIEINPKDITPPKE